MDGRLNFKATLDDGEYMKKLDSMKKGVDGLTFEKPTESINRLKKEIEEVNDVLNKNRKSLSELNSKISTTAPGALKNDLLTQRNSLKKSIQEDEVALRNLNAELQRTRASHTTVNAELTKTRQQMAALALVGKQNTAEYQALSQKAKEYSNALRQVDNETKRASSSTRTFRDIFRSVSSYFGAFTAITTIINLLKSFYNTTKQLQTLSKAMELGSQNSTAYASNLAFLRDITERYGLELISTSEAYNKFYVASKNKLALEEIQLIFDKVSKSASLMGMSMADQEGIFRALEQMMSKGTVQSEELRMQLGDRLPGAFEIMARSMGVTTAQLNKMMEEGEVIASEVLPKFAIELEKTFGADKVDAIDNITAAENRLKNEWVNFVETVNSSGNIVGNVIMGFLDGISALTRDISRLISSWDRLNKVAGEQGARAGYSDVMARANNISQGQAVKEAFRLENDLRDLNKERRELEKTINETKVMSQRGRMRKQLEELNGTIGNVTGQLSAYREIANGIEKVEKSSVTTAKKTDNSAKQRLAFINQIYRLEQEINQSVLSGRELELAKINLRYDELIRKAKELGVTESKINELRQREKEIVTFKIETDSIITGLEAQKKDYEDFENFKKQVGIQKATEMYSDIIDVSKTYMQVLEDEMSKIDLSTATDLEKDRFNTLFKIYQDYNIKKQEEDRKSVENLINTTMSVTDKLRVLYEKYQNDLVELSKKYTGERLKEEEENLQKAFINESDKLSSEILGRADEFQMALEVIGASTRRQAQYQIDSLNKLLQSSNKLSDRQVALIKKTIGELNKVLIAGDDTNQSNRISQINKQIANTESEINRLQKLIEESSKQDFETAEQFAARMKVISDSILVYKERLENLQQDKFLATIEEVSSLSAGFDTLGESLGDFDKNVGSAFKTIGDILKIVGQVGKLIEALGAGVRSAGEASGSPWLAIVGAVVQIAGTVAQMISQAKKAREQARAEFRAFYENLTTAEYEYQQLIRQRRLAAIEANQDISPYESLKQQEEELRKQLIDSANEYQELMTTIMKEGRYISDLQRDKQKNKEIYGDFSNITGDIEEQYAQLEKMFLEGRLEGQTLKWFEALRASKEELESLGYTLEDVIRMQNELVTGTSWSQMSSQIADMFASGTNSAVEFANTMEDLIKNAIVAGFKARFIDEAMQGLFDQLAGFANDEDGLTQSEIDEFNRLAQEAIGGLNNQWQQLIDGLDIDFNSDDLGGSVKDGIKRITETQADRLTGILTGMQMDVIASRQILTTNRNLLSSSLDNLIMIEVNTRQTADNTYQLVQIMQNNQQQSLGL